MNKERTSDILLKKYFEDNSFVEGDIESFNRFVEKELYNIIKENEEVEPTIIPSNVEEFKIRLDNISVEKPEITEADGSKRDLYPSEARIRKLSYAAPIYLEVSSHVNGVQRESYKTQIGSLPIMLKSNKCNLKNLSREELIQKGEDPDDEGGYFIVNGTEKVIVTLEDLASNRFVVERQTTGISEYIGKVFSEQGSYKIPHQIEKLKDSIFYASFTRVKRIPLIVLVKALGFTKDQDIMNEINLPDNGDVFVNLISFSDIKTQEDAQDVIAKKIGITQSKDIRIERVKDVLNKYLLPHIGIDEGSEKDKAVNLLKYLRNFILMEEEKIPLDDKDHFANKRLKMAGDLLADLLRVNIKVLVGDLLYNFQRIVKRGKFPSIKVIIREKLLTQRIYSSMATGNWVANRKGVSQRIQRDNYVEMMSALQRVVSPLSASQENFEARALHPTHMGRLCMSETPEGTNIGLRKNLGLLTTVSDDIDEKQLLSTLEKLGLQTVKQK